MSTVHEVVAARHCGIKVIAFSLISNMCDDDDDDDDDDGVNGPIDNDGPIGNGTSSKVHMSNQ
jgi:purine nucleoside phosphorylase